MIRTTVAHGSLRRARSIMLASTVTLALVAPAGPAQASSGARANSATATAKGATVVTGMTGQRQLRDRRWGHKVG